MQKKKNKHGLWKRLRFKYHISATNENTLEEIWGARFSIFSGIVAVLIFAFVLIGLTATIIIATPIRYYLPGYLDAEVRGEALRAALRIDSLEQEMKYQDLYISNIRDILSGNISIDSIGDFSDTIRIAANDPMLGKTDREQAFVQKYEDEEKYNLSALSSSSPSSGEAFIFFKPVRGAVHRGFDAVKGDLGVGITIQKKENVSSIFDGTVIYDGYDLNSEYVIQIQHNNGFVSVYKNNTILLKKTGDKVKTGEAISIIDIDSETKNNSLYMELWYRGNAVDPEEFITFN